jgi:hypothetical protein
MTVVESPITTQYQGFFLEVIKAVKDGLYKVFQVVFLLEHGYLFA